jgi:D-glycerate 3-kinase
MTLAEQRFLHRNQLPDSYLAMAEQWFQPLLDDFCLPSQISFGPRVILINGSQGSGKSTLADYLCTALKDRQGMHCVALSLDDFYLTRTQRMVLAREVHPLLATRGVPGTHDIPLAAATLNSLIRGQNETLITRFDKSTDDRYPISDCQTISGPVGLIILEGWCVGATAQNDEALETAVNKLEQEEDAMGLWRAYANNALGGTYQRLFKMADTLVMLRAPSFDAIFEWRLEQERKMVAPLMTETEILRFVQHYQRLTEHCLFELPKRADHLFHLNFERQVVGSQ